MIRGLEKGRKAALLVSELQRGVAGDLTMFPALADHLSSRGVLPRLSGLAAAFRKAGHPVFHCHVAHRPDFGGVPVNTVTMAIARKKGAMVVGSQDVEPMRGFTPDPSDFVLVRSAGMTPFYDESLERTLKALGVQTLVLAGVSTNMGVPGRALGGVDRGYQIIVAEDCIAGGSPEVHDFIVREQLSLLATIASADEIAGALAG